jgi:hypothetical protein
MTDFPLLLRESPRLKVRFRRVVISKVLYDRNEAKVPVSGLAEYGEILAQSHRDPPSVTIC